MLVTVNLLYRYAGDSSRIERVIWIDPDRTSCFVIDVHNGFYPYAKQIMDIEEGVKEGVYIIEAADPWFRIVSFETISEKEEERWNQANEIIQMIASKECEPNIFLSKERSKLIKRASETFGVNESTVVKYLKRYWKRGKIKHSLLSDFDACGGAGKERTSRKDKKLGRPRKYASLYSDMAISEELKRLFRISLDKYYYTAKPKQPSLRWAYEQMIKAYFSSEKEVRSGTILPVVEGGSPIPSFGQFRYWFNKWRDPKREVFSREGYRKFQQQNRAILGSSKQDVYAPGSVYQIDSTIADVTIASAFDRTKIIGRPVLYFVVDGYSHLITGLHVGLDSPSWAGGAMLALLNASESKVDFCKRYGIEIREEEWPVSGYLPESILADRGELISKKVLSMIEHLQIAVKNTPPFRPDWKPMVERYFGLLQTHIKPFMPGAVYKDANDRGVRDNRLNASLTLSEVTKILIKVVLHYNNNHLLADYERDENQIAENVRAIPIHLWNYGIQNRSGKLRRVSQDVLKFNLLPSLTAAVTGRGIKVNGMLYSCDTALREHWFIRARTSGRFQVEVNYDPRNVNQVYLRLSRNEYDVCYLLDSQARYKDKFIEDIHSLLSMEKQEKTIIQDQELGQKISLAAEIETIVKEAVQKTKAEMTPQSNAKRLRDIRENRKLEKERNRDQEQFVLKAVKQLKPSAADMDQIDEDNESPNHYDLLKQLQQEGLYGDR